MTRAALADVNAAVGADVDAAVAAGPSLRLLGLAWAETAGTPAVSSFNVVHGATGAGGTLLVPVATAASGSGALWFGDAGIACPNGLSIDWVAGEIDIVLFYVTD